MDRSWESYKNGELVDSGLKDLSWDDLHSERRKWLTLTDNWYWPDRWAQVDAEHQAELNEFRQEWRDITEHETANDAADAAPECPAWARDWE